MKIKYIMYAGAMLLLTFPLQVQGQTAAGRLLRMADFAPTDMLTMSQFDYSFGTARSAAMGGAFTSLGADLSSMYINPAGLGMYRSSEFSFSPSITWNTTSSRASAGDYVTGSDNNRTRFALGSIGVALNTYQAPSGLVSFTFGFGYNKLADFNYNSSVGLYGQLSIVEAMSQQLYGINSTNLESNGGRLQPERNYNPNIWGAILAWQTYALQEYDDGTHRYEAMVDDYADNNYLITNSTGSIGEYSLSGGMNFDNKFYLGFTLGLQDIYQRQYAYFKEVFPEIENPTPLQGEKLRSFQYDQYTRMAGSGVNFKVGMIFRPIEPLRIGLAIHSPTWTVIDRSYQVINVRTERQDIQLWERLSANSITDEWTYSFNTPARLLLGASYQFDDIMLVSADWERVWYNGMRLGSTSGYAISQMERDLYKEDIKYSFKGASNLRFGVEVKPVAPLALRAGYSFYGSPIRSHSESTIPVTPSLSENWGPVSKLDAPVADKTNSFSFGLGYRTGGFSADLAYVYSKTDYTKYGMFWYDGPNNDNVPVTFGSGPVESSMVRNIMTLTLGFRF